MLFNGIYKAENHESIWHDYEVVMTVKETEKSFCFTLVSIDSRYSAEHIRMLFSKSNNVVLGKIGSGHVMRIWSDKDFTLYPYQAGIPFYFKYMSVAEIARELFSQKTDGECYKGSLNQIIQEVCLPNVIETAKEKDLLEIYRWYKQNHFISYTPECVGSWQYSGRLQVILSDNRQFSLGSTLL